MTNIESGFTPDFCEIDRSKCIFCESSHLQVGQSTVDFVKTYPRLHKEAQVVASSPNHYVISDIAPVTEDHLLVISRDHFPSFAALAPDIKGESEELAQSIVERMRSLHEDKEIILFEHGVGAIGNSVINCGGCGGNDHAHLHILPVPRTPDLVGIDSIACSVAESYSLNLHETLGATNLDFMPITGGAPYLFVASADSNSGFLLVQPTADIVIPSQLLRKEIATKILGYKAEDITGWHWRDMLLFNPQLGEERVLRTLSRWSNQQEGNEGT